MNTHPRFTDLDIAPHSAWRKSSYSGGTGNSCVEVAETPAGIGLRDSKNPTGPALLLAPATWTRFLTHVRVRG
ncbi:DUF397 domain-containing protein [Streptomyces sp. NBC_01003]|uniref:DUF397 domain-containing protein n=1 Tax=Streptomyces sp. NBC_01003 TaxID=2903714 RepID=UPI003865ABBB|nr:DUF397 domain-containing protein [Streptomyces sp. NBC_01003]